jgi:hypothetical protein
MVHGFLIIILCSRSSLELRSFCCMGSRVGGLGFCFLRHNLSHGVVVLSRL